MVSLPELPEVETVVRGLRERILNCTITSARIHGEKLRDQNPRNFSALVRNRRVIGIRRRGKHIFLDLSDGVSLWCHLRMTGRFIEADSSYRRGKHDHAIFHFQSNSSGEMHKSTKLVWRDVRKFGFVRALPTAALDEQPALVKLGPEPFDISVKEFVELFKSRNRAIKPALLDQTLIAGVGNIYADEALFASGVHPLTASSEMSGEQLKRLRKELLRLLKLAIRRMGTTVDSYSGVNGAPGSFQEYLKVYGREGEPCLNCGSPIIRKVIAQRSAHFCGNCQRMTANRK